MIKTTPFEMVFIIRGAYEMCVAVVSKLAASLDA